MRQVIFKHRVDDARVIGIDLFGSFEVAQRDVFVAFVAGQIKQRQLFFEWVGNLSRLGQANLLQFLCAAPRRLHPRHLQVRISRLGLERAVQHRGGIGHVLVPAIEIRQHQRCIDVAGIGAENRFHQCLASSG